MSTALQTTNPTIEPDIGQKALVGELSSAHRTSLEQPSDWVRKTVASSSFIPLAIVGAAFIAMAVVAFLWATAPNYQILYSNLSDADSGTIINELEQRAVPYKLSAGGNAILVPQDQVHTLRFQLAEAGLPEGGKVGFELLENQSFGISQFAEQINFQRGLEGELSRSIEVIGPVSLARVHLAMAKPSVFVNQRTPSKASVVLTLHPGRSIGEAQVSAIVHMVSSSVPDLALEDISVVDQSGNLLSKSNETSAALNSAQLGYIQDVEQSYRERVSTILAPILGEENFEVQVTTDISFSSIEETREAYSPNQNPANSSIRSAQSSTNFSGNENLARGIPGALSNTPPNTALTAIDGVLNNNAAANPGQAETEENATLRRDDTINYELDRSFTRILHDQGIPKRLSVAVVVNDKLGINEDGEEVLMPLSVEDLDQLTRLVRQAVGFLESRGDVVEVINSSFTPVEVIESEDSVWWQTPYFINLAVSSLKYLLASLGLILGYKFLVAPLLNKYLAEQPASEAAALAAAGASAAASDAGNTASKPFQRTNKAASYGEQLKEIQNIAKEDPRLIAMVLRNWAMTND